jgi:hypothetical protein
MSQSSTQLERNNVVSDDPRWELVERIIASPSFIKSPRLCSFLTYICELTLQGRTDEINELNLGEALFARAPNYDPSIDGIVRSHASRLRQRLEQYFSEEGSHETIRLSIPKGGYTPLFELLPVPLAEEEIVLFPSQLANVGPAVVLPGTATQVISTPWIVRALTLALTLACIAIVYLVFHQRTGLAAAAVTATRHPLWSSLFGPDHPTMIVASDTGLTTLQTITGKNVRLAEYLNDDYRDHINPPVGTTIEVARTLASRRYTSIVDLKIVTKLYMLPGIPLNRIQVRYARDVRPDDFKSGPVIMLGAQEGTPWVELFEDRMNFVFRHDRQKHSFLVLNRSPQRNELAQYDSDQADPLHKVYGLIALQPNLEGSGQILLLEGTSMAGTESAADFIFDDARLLPFLNKIKNKDGSLPYFELLLQSNNMNGNASKSEILVYRTSPSSQSASQ